MHINKLNQNMAGANGITENAAKSGRKRAEEENFKESFRRSLCQEGKDVSDADLAKRKDEITAGSSKPAGKAENISIRPPESGVPGSAEEVPVRGLTYEECDGLEINVLEGYAVKAKYFDENSGEDKPGIYVEAKYDDGNTKGYLVDIKSVGKESDNPIERIAVRVGKEREGV